ncbi:hypothetical protein [Pseudomonas fluorescens]|uniref:hypothetical protein n=1 Tax=Pseudomonas fluorescens TaxID=294 RepID=UPI00177E6AA3|nr:hypothetical protein [Pseudomonas fluorescens]
MISAACDFVFLNSHEHIHSMKAALQCFFKHIKTMAVVFRAQQIIARVAGFEISGVTGDAIASRLAPTVEMHSNVGASLLAMAIDQTK